MDTPGSHHKKRLRRRSAAPLSLVLALAMAAGPGRAAQAGELASADDVSRIASAAVEAAGVGSAPATAAFAGGPDVYTAHTLDTQVTLTEGDLTVSQQSGASVNLAMPAGTSDQGQVASDGSVVLASSSSDFAVVVGAQADGNVRVQTVVDSASGPDSFSYPMSLPEGAQLVPRPDGGVDVMSTADAAAEPGLTHEQAAALLPPDSDVELDPSWSADSATAPPPTLEELQQPVPAVSGPIVLAHLPAPWAVDASGQPLPTRFAVDGATLTQLVDMNGAQFPVVADPFFVPMIYIGLSATARALAPAAIRAFTATTIRAGAQATTRGGYRTFDAFKRAHGDKPDYQWHHIVEQNQLRRFAAEEIHHPNNLISLPRRVHEACINSWMSSKRVTLFGLARQDRTMRDIVGQLDFPEQHRIGVELLRHCGVEI